MTVRFAPVVQPRDRFLPHIATLCKRHGALVERGLLGDHGVVEIDAVTRPPVLDPQAFDRLLGDHDRARLLERRSQRLGGGGFAQQIDADVGADRPRVNSPDRGSSVRVLGRGQFGDGGDRRRFRPDQRQQPSLQRPLVQLDRVADAEAADHVEQLLQRHALGVEQQLIVCIEDAQVAEHLALRGQERRVTAAPRRQRFDVVRHLALEEALRVRARQRELAARGAIEQAASLGDRSVLRDRGVEGRHPETQDRNLAALSA